MNQQPGVGGMPNMIGISPSSMMASSPQQQMPGMMGQQPNPGAMGMPGPQPQPTDNISKVKSLMVPLRDSLSVNICRDVISRNNRKKNVLLILTDNAQTGSTTDTT